MAGYENMNPGMMGGTDSAAYGPEYNYSGSIAAGTWSSNIGFNTGYHTGAESSQGKYNTGLVPTGMRVQPVNPTTGGGTPEQKFEPVPTSSPETSRPGKPTTGRPHTPTRHPEVDIWSNPRPVQVFLEEQINIRGVRPKPDKAGNVNNRGRGWPAGIGRDPYVVGHTNYMFGGPLDGGPQVYRGERPRNRIVGIIQPGRAGGS